MKKILFAGHTGLRKRAVLESLKSEIENQLDKYKNLVQVYDLDDYIKQAVGVDPSEWPALRNVGQMRQDWANGWQQLTKAMREEIPKAGCALVAAHLVYYRNGRPISPVRFDLIADWQPDTVVTLIDDLFAVRNRIPSKYPFPLSELYSWRMTEWVLADQIAWAVGAAKPSGKHIPNYLLSVKQPIHMLFRLLLSLETSVVYASFPISSTRPDPSKKEAINRFRSQLHKVCTVFDPLTIDERIMQTWAEEAEHDVVRFDFGTEGPPGRWDCRVTPKPIDPNDPKPPNYDPLLWDDDLGTAEIPLSEIQALFQRIGLEGESDIDEQITWRDYRLISQADYVACYRPFLGDAYHGGVDSEVSYANDLTTHVYAFSPDQKPGKALKGKITFPFSDEGEFWDQIAQLKPDKPRRAGRIMF